MADEIRLKITGDKKHLEKTIKSAEKLVDRFGKSARNATKRRLAYEKRTHALLTRVHKKTAAQNIKTQKIAERAIIKGVKSRTRREIAEVKKLGSQKTAETRKSLAMDKRLSRKRARNRLRQMKSRQREELRRERTHARRMRKIRSGIGRGIGRMSMIGGIGGMLGGIGLVYKSRQILDFDVKLASLASQAKITKKAQFELRESMTDVAIATGVQRDVILDSIRRIVDKSGEYQVAADNVEKLSKIIRGTQTDPGELGEIVGALATTFKDIRWDNKRVPIFDLIEILIAQGDDASVTLRDLAANGEELMGAFTMGALKSLKDFKAFFALVQMAGRGGTSAEAATMTKNFVIQILKNAKDIEKNIGAKGPFEFRGKGYKRLKQPILGPNGGIRDVEGVVKDLLQASGGKVSKILDLIPRYRGAAPIALMGSEFEEFGTTKAFDRVIKLGDTAGGILERRYLRVAETASQGFERVLAIVTKLSDVLLLPALNELSDSLIELANNKDKMDELVQTFKDFGETLRLIAKSGAAVANIINPILAKRRKGIELQERINKLSQKQKAGLYKGGGFFESPKDIRMRNLEEIERTRRGQRMRYTSRAIGPQKHRMGLFEGMKLNITNFFNKGGEEQHTTVEFSNDGTRGATGAAL